MLGNAILPAILAFGLNLQDPAPAAHKQDAGAVIAGLEQGDAVTIAIAARAARELGDKNLAGPLQKTLRRLTDETNSTEWIARLFVLDALIGIDVRMPPTHVLPLLDEPLVGDAAFLLLARESRGNEAELFAVFRRDWPTLIANQAVTDPAQVYALSRRTRAIGNLLCAQKTPGFAAVLLAQSDLRLQVTVTSPGGPDRPHPVESGFTTDQTLVVPTGLPPLPLFRIVRTDRPEGLVAEDIAPGPMGLGVSRRECKVDATGKVTLEVRNGNDGPLDALPWLLKLVDRTDTPRLKVSISFTDPNSYLRELQAAVDAVKAYRDKLLQDLLAAKALGREDAERLGKRALDVQFLDLRLQAQTQLPRLPTPK
jgi:hypothetical protein